MSLERVPHPKNQRKPKKYFLFELPLYLIMYQDTFEDDDLIAEVELVAQARYSQNNDIDDGFDTEGTFGTEKTFLFNVVTKPLQ